MEKKLQDQELTEMPELAVVILNWNGRAYLEQFLPFILNSGYSNLRVIVGDNASADDSVSFVRTHFPSVEILENEENLGFAGGYNSILKRVDSDYFCLLNSDVEVSPGWIEPVLTLMEKDKSVAAVQPKLLSFGNRNSFEYAGAAGGFIDIFGYPFCRGRVFDHVETDHGQYNNTSEIFWASGAALFIRRSCWEEAGGFDTSFFAHMEEIDLCWRLKNLGYKIMYCPSSTVYHIGGGTLQADNPYKTYLNFRNNLTMLLKNLPAAEAFSVIFIRLWLDLISLIKFASAGKFKQAKAVSNAHSYFFLHFNSNRKKRIKDFSSFNKTGMINKSIVWQYFVKGRKVFGEIVGKK